MQDCLFCQIIKGKLPGKFVYRDTKIVAFYDINPKAPVHVLVLPVKHIKSLQDIKGEDGELMGRLLLAVNKIAKKLGIAQDGYKVIVNNGQASGQLVFHLHVHLLGGWKQSVHWEV